MAQTELQPAAKRDWMLPLIGVAVLAILGLLWAIVTLRDTPCNWFVRLRGSGCIQVFSRDMALPSQAGNVYFSADDSRLVFLDGETIRIEPVRQRSAFGAVKSIPIFPPGAKETHKNLFYIEDFTLSPDGKMVVLCADYHLGELDYKSRLLLKEIDPSANARFVLPDTDCFWREISFVSPSVFSLNSSEAADKRVLFFDVRDDTLRSLPGMQLKGFSENSTILPIQVEEKISLYSFPDFKETGQLSAPSELDAAIIPLGSSYIFAEAADEPVIYMIERSSGELVYTFSDKAYQRTRAFTVSRQGDLVAAVFSRLDSSVIDSVLYVWDARDRQVVGKFSFDHLSNDPRWLDFSSDGKLLAVGTSDYVMILDLTK